MGLDEVTPEVSVDGEKQSKNRMLEDSQMPSKKPTLTIRQVPIMGHFTGWGGGGDCSRLEKTNFSWFEIFQNEKRVREKEVKI